MAPAGVDVDDKLKRRTEFARALLASGAITRVQSEELIALPLADVDAAAEHVLDEGWAGERAICTVLADHIGHPTAILGESTIDLAALRLVPEHVAREQLLLPVSADDDVLQVATVQVYEGSLVEQIASVTGRRVVLLRALSGVLHDVVPAAWAALGAGATMWQGDRSGATTPAVEIVRPRPRVPAPDVANLVRRLSSGSLVGVGGPIPSSSSSATSAASNTSSPPAPAPTTEAIAAALPRAPTLPVPALTAPRTETRQMVSGVAAAAPSMNPDGPLVLVVEDDDGIRKMIVQALRHDGRNVMEAADGHAAIAALRTTKPTLVILDAMLPGLHGFEVCKTIKRSGALKDTYVIMASAVYRGWEHARSIQESFGADAFLEKPFSVHVLRAMVAEVLGQQVARRVLAPDRAQHVARVRAEVDAAKREQRWDAALEHVGTWLSLDPFDPAAHVEHGNIQLQRGVFDRAMYAYETALAYDKNNFPAQVNLAGVYERLGFRRKSDEAWRKAAALAPDDDIAQRILARFTAPAAGAP